MKFVEKKSAAEVLLEFSIVVVSGRDETHCVGNVHNVSGTRVAEFIFLSETTLIVDVKVVLNHLKFHLSAISITLHPNCHISMEIL